MPGAGDAKVRSIGGPVDADLFEDALVAAFGAQNSGDSGKYAEVRFLKNIIAGHRREARGVRIPGTECARGNDLPGRARIRERCNEIQSAVVGGRSQPQMLDVKLQRVLAGLIREGPKNGIFADDFADSHGVKLFV